MATQNAKRDENRTTGLLIQDSTGAETRQVRSTVANPNAIPVEIVASSASGEAVTIADGADVTQGAIGDASVSAGATGTISAKLRRISADIDSIKTALATGATGVVKLEDSPHASGDAGIPSWNVANEAQTALAADGDYIPHSADTKGNTIVVGPVASGSTAGGAPVRTSGVYQTTQPTVTDGQVVNGQSDTRGNNKVTLMATDTASPIASLTLYPGIVGTDLVSGDTGKSGVLSRIWRAVVTHSASGSWTYSVGSSIVL